jgi:hypothetical protein
MDEETHGAEDTVGAEYGRPPTVEDVDIPFASPGLLWRMKKNTYREKDIPDLIFLKQHYPEVCEG